MPGLVKWQGRRATLTRVLVAVGCFIVLTALASARQADDPPASLTASSASVPLQPAQPTHGPGSSDYPHAAFRLSKHGEGVRQYWLLTPAEPRPERAPVVVFLHGWSSLEPSVYGAWIKHLVRRGNIVVFPRYQKDVRTLPREMAGHAAAAIRDAIERLESKEWRGPRPDLNRFALVGHSMGAILAANLAERASELELPQPKALLLAEPAFEPLVGKYDEIAADTLFVVAVGADVRRDSSARRIFLGSSRVPAENKSYVVIPSDDHGNPPLVSDHFAPCAAESFDESDRDAARENWRARTRDAIDYFGYWKLCDGLLDAAFFGRHRAYALGDTPEQRFMGRWSDGVAITEAKVLGLGDFSGNSVQAGR